MTTIVTRAGLGRKLTWNEADTNFTNLNTDKIEQLADDITPSLGGNLDTKNFSISSSTGNVLVSDTLSTHALQIDTTQVLTPGVGKLIWDDLNGTLQLGLIGGNVNLQLGQEELIRIHNNSGSTLTDGQLVYINGSSGNRPTVALASNTTEGDSSVTMGMVTESIANGSEGFVTVSGIVNNLNTLAFAPGTPLWLGASPGTWTSTKPIAPNHAVLIGYVVRSHASIGSVLVKIQNGYELDELHNVLITSVADNDILKYDSTAGVWKNTPLGSSSIPDQTGQAGQFLQTDGTNLDWVSGSNQIPFLDASGVSKPISLSGVTSGNSLSLADSLTFGTSAVVYTGSGNYGWRDITSDISVKGTGTNNPSWGLIRNGLYGYTFSATTMQEAWVNFHINHDYALGTPIYLHAHWVNPGTNTGVVRWGFEYSIAKGHQQEIFPNTTTVYVNQACTGQYYHMIAEIDTGISSASLEPDSLILVRVFRDAANAADTCTDAVALIMSDVHYQANKWATKNRSPNFNT